MKKRICKLLILPIVTWSAFIGYGFYINYDYNQLKDFNQVFIAAIIGLIIVIGLFCFLMYIKYNGNYHCKKKQNNNDEHLNPFDYKYYNSYYRNDYRCWWKEMYNAS